MDRNPHHHSSESRCPSNPPYTAGACRCSPDCIHISGLPLHLEDMMTLQNKYIIGIIDSKSSRQAQVKRKHTWLTRTPHKQLQLTLTFLLKCSPVAGVTLCLHDVSKKICMIEKQLQGNSRSSKLDIRWQLSSSCCRTSHSSGHPRRC